MGKRRSCGARLFVALKMTTPVRIIADNSSAFGVAGQGDLLALGPAESRCGAHESEPRAVRNDRVALPGQSGLGDLKASAKTSGGGRDKCLTRALGDRLGDPAHFEGPELSGATRVVRLDAEVAQDLAALADKALQFCAESVRSEVLRAKAIEPDRSRMGDLTPGIDRLLVKEQAVAVAIGLGLLLEFLQDVGGDLPAIAVEGSGET